MEESKDLAVLGAITNGIDRFDKIQKIIKINPNDLNSILEELEKRELIKVEEEKGWLGKKIMIRPTEKGGREVENRVQELEIKWNQMSQIYKTGNKEKLKQYMNDNKSHLPMMMFFGVMDMMMFSMMFGMMGMAMSDFVPAEDIPEGLEGDGMDGNGSSDDGFDIGF